MARLGFEPATYTLLVPKIYQRDATGQVRPVHRQMIVLCLVDICNVREDYGLPFW